MPTWPLGSGHQEDEDIRRSENEGFGQEAELHEADDQHRDVRDTDVRDSDVGDTDVRDADRLDTDAREANLQDVDAQDRYPESHDVPVASSPVETEEAYPAQNVPLQDTRVDEAPVDDTPVQDTPGMNRPSEVGQSLLEPGFADTFQQRWREIQANFVDDPHETVREADQFADEVVSTLTTALTNRKHSLDERWQAEKENTEELRLALRGYREFLGRLIKL